MRFVIAMMQHETNTFSPLPTTYRSFAHGTGLDTPPSGAQALACYGKTSFPFAAFVDLAREQGAEIIVPIAAYAEPSGPVADDAFEAITEAICTAVKAGCDGVMLDLHGAMVTQRYDDGEGKLLHRIRAIAPDLPIAVALDFHANMTQQMVDNTTVITGYRTYPHVDMYETGLRAGRTLLKFIQGQVNPVIHWGALPMLTHMLRQTPTQQPMKDIMDQAIDAEAGGQVLNASVFGGFPLADIPHAGLSAVVVEQQGTESGLLPQLLTDAWQRRADFVFHSEPLEHSIAYAKTLEQGPVLLADHGDNCGAGGSQDDMTVLAEVMRQGLNDVAAGPIWDPESVGQMMAAGVGNTVTLNLGGKTDSPALGQKGQPLLVSGVVRRLTDGSFTVTCPMQTGLQVHLGRTGVLDTGTVQIVVSEQRWEPFDTGCFTHAGIDLAHKHYVLIKSRQHFRAGFESLAKHIVLVAGPGVCSSDYVRFPFRNLRRPIYPLDEMSEIPYPKNY